MDPLLLQLRPADAPQRDAVAWRLPGGDPHLWLQRIAQWDVAHRDVELLPLPTSTRDRTTQAVLVRVRPRSSSESERSASPPSWPNAIPYGAIASRFFLPVDASLWPNIHEDEISSWAASRTFVWQPQSGLVSMDSEPWLPLAKFIARPAWTLGDWEAPREGLILAPRIVALRAELPPDPEEIMEQGQEDIGSKTDADQMPQAPGESKPGAVNAAKNQAQKMAANAAGAVSKVLPGNWAERLGAWAERQHASADRRMEVDRNKEIERLMNLMENDPDEGLKFAPPLAGDTAPRGQAEPSGRLEEREVNFNFSRLTSGGPGEAWNVDGAYYYKLRMRYREAANRELQLKRFRRAAYIFSELLGDHQGAAGALAQGKFYREAATLYQKKLGMSRRAAECLEQGGLLTDAIEIYLELEMFEKAGDLYNQLNQPEAAERHYLLAVEAMRESGATRDHLAIAELLNAKLGQREAAMQELSEAWPHSSQPVACLRQWFDLADPETDLQMIESQISSVTRADITQVFASAEILCHAAHRHGGKIEATARDALQSLISRNVLDVQPTRRPQLMSYLQRLHPTDRLLIRDCRNYLQRQVKRAAAPPIGAGPSRAGWNRLLKRTQLPEDVNWSRICLLDDVVFAVGKRGRQIAIVATPWCGDAASVELPWQEPQVTDDSVLLVATHAHQDSTLVIHPFPPEHGQPLLPRHIRGIKRRSNLVASGMGVPQGTLALCRANHGLTWTAAYVGSQLVAACCRGDITVSSRTLIDDSELEPPEYLPQIAAGGETVFVSWASMLFIVESDAHHVFLHDMPQEIRTLACSAPHTLCRVAMGYEIGGSILWHGLAEQKILSFGDGLVQPRLCITRGGYLVAAGTKRIEAYSTRRRTLKLIGENEDGALDPVDVIAGPGSHEFIVLNQNGELQFYEMA